MSAPMWNGMDILLWLQDIRLGMPEWFNEFVNILSDSLYLVIPIIAVLALYWCADKKYGTAALFSLLFSFASVSALKGLLCVARPWDLNPSVEPFGPAAESASGLSCPSGHTTVASSIFTTLALISKKKLIVIFCAAIIFITAVTRVYLGVHTPLDVIIGAIVGIVISVISYLIASHVNENNIIITYVFVLALVFFAIAMVTTYFLPSYFDDGVAVTDFATNVKQICKYGGLMFGGMIGWYLERRYVGFDPCAPKKTERFFFGLLSAMAVAAAAYCIPYLLGSKSAALLIGGLVFGIYCFFCYPLILKHRTT